MPTYTTEQGYQLHYELYGELGDPVVTIVNGLSMRTSHWAPYFEMLPAAGCRVLSYDMLGQGKSSKPVLGVDFDDHVHMLRELHGYLGITRPYVMGISFGGVVALKYGIAFPDTISGVLPASTFSEMDPQLHGHSMNLFTGLSRVGFEYYLDLLMPLNFTNRWLAQNEEFIEASKRAGVSTNELYGIQNLMESLSTFRGITEELPEIRCPTLILNGEYDYLTPRHLHDRILQQVRNARLVLIQNACHAFTLETPELTTRIIAEFVSDVERGTWKGDQTVWIAAEDPSAEPLLFPCRGDHRRAIPFLPAEMPPDQSQPAEKHRETKQSPDSAIVQNPGRPPAGSKTRPSEAPKPTGGKPDTHGKKPIGGAKGGG